MGYPLSHEIRQKLEQCKYSTCFTNNVIVCRERICYCFNSTFDLKSALKLEEDILKHCCFINHY